MELTLKPHSDNTERELSVERKTRDVTIVNMICHRLVQTSSTSKSFRSSIRPLPQEKPTGMRMFEIPRGLAVSLGAYQCTNPCCQVLTCNPIQSLSWMFSSFLVFLRPLPASSYVISLFRSSASLPPSI